ncbi:MAG: hypothetical protein WBL50_24815 [Candidatus Acidiferrum sp.]
MGKNCLSENQHEFSGELSVAFDGLQRINLAPVYICQKILVCLDCGHTELVIPTPELERLRKGMGYHPIESSDLPPAVSSSDYISAG